MILLITGTPGSGKTLFVVTKLIKEINANPDRLVYSDIEGLKIDGVLPVPDDWRDCEDGSLIIYDECHFRPMFQKDRGRTKYQAVKDLTVHRHTGKDIWLITQSPNFLHADLLALVGEHIHLDRPLGAELANVYKWRTAQDKPNGVTVKKRAEDTWLFKYDKNIFKYYDSVDVADDKANHKKFKMPFWRVAPLLFGVCLISYAVYSYMFDGGITPVKSTNDTAQVTQNKSIADTTDHNAFNITQDDKQTVSQDNSLDQRRLYLYSINLPEDYTIRRQDDYLQVRGVVMMSNKCTAYNALGDMMTLSQDDCKQYVGTGKVYRSNNVSNGSVSYNPPTEQTPATLPATEETPKI